MPLVKRTIEPVQISRNRVTTGIKNELEFVTNSTLGDVIRQMSSLSKHVEDIFGELHHESCSLFNRTCQLNERIDRLKIKITQLNPTVEEVLLQDINMRKPFKSSLIKDQQIITLATRSYAVTEVYERCEPPPALQKLNPYRHDGKDSLKFYTEPGYFFELWCQAMQKDTKCQMKRHKRVRRPFQQKMTSEPPKVPTNPCEENRKALHDVNVNDTDQVVDASFSRYGCVQYLDGQVHPGAVDLRKNRDPAGRASESQGREHVGNDARAREPRPVVTTSDLVEEYSVDDAAAVTENGERTEPTERETDGVVCSDPVTDSKLMRPSSLELPSPVTSSACFEKINSQAPVTNDLNHSEEPGNVESLLHSRYSACQPAAAGTEAEAGAPQNIPDEQTEPARTSLPLSLTMCKATVEIPTTNKELSLLVELVSSKHMSGAKVSSSSILGGLPTVPPPPLVVASAAAAEVQSPGPRGSQVADLGGKDQLLQTSPNENIEQDAVDHGSNQSSFPGHSISVASNGAPPDEDFWCDSLPAELTTKTSTPDSVDLPPPPSPPPPFSQTPDSPGLVSLPPLPPPPLEEADVVKLGFIDVQPLPLAQVGKAVDSGCGLLPNGKVRYLPPSTQNAVSVGTPQVDPSSNISDSGLVTVSSGSTRWSECVAAVAPDLPLVRDTRCDLLAAIREGLKLRKVEERRQKTAQKHLPTRRLDVQTIMEAAFEMRRKVLEENDSEEEEDEFDSNWSDDD